MYLLHKIQKQVLLLIFKTAIAQIPATVRTIQPSTSPTLTDTRTSLPSSTISPTQGLTLDITDSSAIAAWFNRALQTNDLSPFEFFLPNIPRIWAVSVPDGPNMTCVDLLGEWCDISKEEFLNQLIHRMNNPLTCYYRKGQSSLILEIGSWPPKRHGPGLMVVVANLVSYT